MSRRFTISDLRTLAARALHAADYTPAASARVRAVPDTRTIRYYTTLGLIDGPAQMRGRTAYYSDRHVLQLVAIKRLQANGMSLSEVQETLLGITKAKLSRIADLPDGFWDAADEYLNSPQKAQRQPGPVPPPAVEASAETRREDFWAVAAAVSRDVVQVNGGNGKAKQPKSATTNAALLSRCLRISLQPGVELSIELPTETNHSGVDLDRLHVSARPLIDELMRQGLLPEPPLHSSPETP